MNAEHTHKPVINMQECLNKNAGQIAVLRERVLLGYEPVIVFLHIMAGSNYPLLYINRPIKPVGSMHFKMFLYKRCCLGTLFDNCADFVSLKIKHQFVDRLPK